MSTETKFTKGDWKALNGDTLQKEIIITTDGRREDFTIPICEMDVIFDGEVGQEQEANAHLIAAAPKMYEMLNAIADDNTDIHGDFSQQIYELLAQARGE